MILLPVALYIENPRTPHVVGMIPYEINGSGLGTCTPHVVGMIPPPGRRRPRGVRTPHVVGMIPEECYSWKSQKRTPHEFSQTCERWSHFCEQPHS